MKKLQLLYLLFAFSLSCSAQNNIPANAKQILISKSWIINGPENDIYKIVFTSTKMFLYSKGLLIGDPDYYLSNNLNEGLGGGLYRQMLATTN
jgi:hypothetical protein